MSHRGSVQRSSHVGAQKQLRHSVVDILGGLGHAIQEGWVRDEHLVELRGADEQGQSSPKWKYVTYAAKIAQTLAHGLGHFGNHRLRAGSQRNGGEHARSVRKALGSFVLCVRSLGKLGLRGGVVHAVGGLLLQTIQCGRGIGDGTSRGQNELLRQII
jgi:hypothetical protein